VGELASGASLGRSQLGAAEISSGGQFSKQGIGAGAVCRAKQPPVAGGGLLSAGEPGAACGKTIRHAFDVMIVKSFVYASPHTCPDFSTAGVVVSRQTPR
jgi:hypothetical protein